MCGMKYIYLYIFQILFISSKISCTYNCLDENNNPVDWYVVYKIPKIKPHSNQLVRNGVAYAYITSETDDGWVMSDKSINDTTSMPGITLASLYGSSYHHAQTDLLYVLYNDQPPVGDVSFSGGHTKGVVVAGDSGGFWLVHSVPHFPPTPMSKYYSYPKTGVKNGQTFLCISLHSDQLDIVGNLLMYNYPHIYANHIPKTLESQYVSLAKAAIGTDVKVPPWYHSGMLVSSQGVNFQAFAKSPKFEKDLYSDWVSSVLQVSLLVETWPNGPGRLSSSCHKPYRVENVDEVNLAAGKTRFSSHKDHSKWAVSEMKDEPWVCIGDINRALSQEKRGGGTVCMKDPGLWKAFFSSISGVESCHMKKHHYHHHYEDIHVTIV